MRYALILIAIFILGCENETAIQTQDWEPTADQALKAEETAKSYAIAEFKLSDTQLSKMKTELTGWKKDGISVIYIKFYDPKHFPNWKNIAGVLGGFPAYFTISIDAKTGTVVDHYASIE